MLWKKKNQKSLQNTVEIIKNPALKPASGKPGIDTDNLKKLEERIDEKISLLTALEEKAGKQIEALEKLIYSSMASKPSAGMINRSGEILALKEKGLDAREISKILSVPAGEVELILNLNKKSRP